jgi:hypothetical protein
MKQLQKLSILLEQKRGIKGRDERIESVNAWLEDKGFGSVQSGKELTKDQASLLIDELEQEEEVEHAEPHE